MYISDANIFISTYVQILYVKISLMPQRHKTVKKVTKIAVKLLV